MKNSGSSEQLDADGDTGSEVSSEVSFSYEFAQTEVLMKALGSNGEGVQGGPADQGGVLPRHSTFLSS